MDASRVSALRELLAPTGWVERTRAFASSLRSSTGEAGGLLLLGTPDEEPWHLAAHLTEEARRSGIQQITPTLVRWAPPAGAPPHLAVGLDRLLSARRGESLFVVAPDLAPASLLERVADARRAGATIFTLDAGDRDLEDLAHESLVVPGTGPLVPATAPLSLDVVAHLVSAAAGETGTPARPGGVRDRLARSLRGARHGR